MKKFVVAALDEDGHLILCECETLSAALDAVDGQGFSDVVLITPDGKVWIYDEYHMFRHLLMWAQGNA